MAEDVRQDAAIHSRFWVDRSTPPPGPYIYYGDDSVVLMDYQNQQAEFGYCFPTTDSVYGRQAVAGVVTVQVVYPNNAIVSQTPDPGQLWVSVSGDGIAWSEPQYLEAGRRQISIGSPVGTAYVRFSGTRVALDSINVSLDVVPATIYVSSNSTIQAAIDAAHDGDIIEVAAGAYSGNIDFHGKAITLRSADGPQYTTINASGGRGFYFHSGEDSNSVVSGFRIINGNVSGPGGGIYCIGSSPTITDCIIENCRATYGGGIALEQSNATITLCDIEGNYASFYGGGLYASNSVAFFGGCYLSNNSVSPQSGGGGVFCSGMLTDIVFRNCVITSNSAGQGAGLCTQSGTGRVVVANCTVADNTSQGVYSINTDIVVTNSIIWGNGSSLYINGSWLALPVTYCDVQGGYTGEGNFNADPLFVGAGDYHLQSNNGRYPWGPYDYDSVNSPCLDAGDLVISAAREPDANGERINLGAYGGTDEASKSIEHTVYHVATNGGNDFFSGLSPESAFKTIGHALEVAQTGDTILVWPGVYEEDLTFQGAAVTVRSAADAAVLVAKDEYAVSFFTAEGSRSILSNFVIRGSRQAAILCQLASPTLRNLTIVDNQFGVICTEGLPPYIANCIFWNNTDGDLFGCTAFFSDVQDDKNPQAGNISRDPLFVDPINGDYHLQSPVGRYVPSGGDGAWILGDTQTSPCIDAGNPGNYFEAELEPNGGAINMGAYGGTPYASKSPY